MTVRDTLQQRATTHGDYDDVAFVAQLLKGSMRHGSGWDDLSHGQHESLDLIATKIARILAGDPNHREHWHDIAGYATLVADRLPRSNP